MNQRFDALGNALRRVLAVVLLALAAAPALADGPYLKRESDGSAGARYAGGKDQAGSPAEQHIGLGDPFVVDSVGAMPAFQVRLRPIESTAPDQIRVGKKTPLFVIADTHGEYEIVGELLQKQRIVDDALRWSFGKGHVIVLGDVFDRGPNQIEILWLFYELQAQAAKAGGGFHLLLGNHEAMVMSGDVRYLHPKYVRSAQALGVTSYQELVAPDTVLGQWLRTRPAVLKVREWLFLHGGVSPQLIDRALALGEINATVRESLSGAAPASRDLVMGPLGPLWYRGYFPEVRNVVPATSDDVDRVLKHFGVAAIAVGHTNVPTVASLYGGRVIAVQVYPHRDEASGKPVMESLRIDGSKRSRATIDGRLEPLH